MSSPGRRTAPLDAAIDETVITEGADEPSLARDMIEVHGTEAATVARDNARAAALGGKIFTGEVLDQGAGNDPKTAVGQDSAEITDISLALRESSVKRTKVGFIYNEDTSKEC